MRYWDDTDLPLTYSLAQHFPIGQRYFCSALAQTYPNRRFFFAGTASGLIATDITQSLKLPAANGTICDRLDAHKISWGVYYENLPSFLIVPGVSNQARANRQHHFTQFLTDAAAGKLPQFSFVDPNYTTTSEENPQDMQVGEEFLAEVVHAADDLTAVEEHGAVHHLRRARRLLRPRAAAAGDQAGHDRRRYSPPATPGARTTATDSACR